MKKEKVSCFLPCRKGSERVPKKNIKPFAGHEFGLVGIKLRQLVEVPDIDEIVLSTNDEVILDYAERLKSPKIHLHHRADELSSSETSTDELVAHALGLIPEGEILWTHVTSPFVGSQMYSNILKKYYEIFEAGYDSLMTTTLLHAFLWQDERPLNYDRAKEKWPRTQTITPVHEVNSAVFLASSNIYRSLDDRIGKKPYLYAMDKLTSHDIDWPEDFVIAESLVMQGLVDL